MTYKEFIEDLDPVWYFTFEDGDLTNYGNSTSTIVDIGGIVYSASANGPGNTRYISLNQDGDYGWAGLAGPAIYNDGYWTFATWFRSDTSKRTGTFRYINHCAGAGGGNPITIFLQNDGTLRTILNIRDFSTSASFDDGNWHSLVVVQEPTTLKAYVDDNVVINQTFSSTTHGIDFAPKQFARSYDSDPDKVWWGDLAHFTLLTQAITTASVISRFYNDGIPAAATNITASATPFSASALFTTASVSTEFGLNFSASAFSASSLFVNPTFTAGAEFSYSASAFSASALMTDATASVGTGYTAASVLFTASALFVDSTASAGTGYSFTSDSFSASAEFATASPSYGSTITSGTMDANALMESAEFNTNGNIIELPNAFTATAQMQSASVTGDAIFSSSAFSASALMAEATASAITNGLISADPLTASALAVDSTVATTTGISIRSYGSYVMSASPAVYVPLDDLYQEDGNRDLPDGYTFNNYGLGGTSNVTFTDGVPSVPTDVDITYDGFWNPTTGTEITATRSALYLNGGANLSFNEGGVANATISFFAKEASPKGGTGANGWGILQIGTGAGASTVNLVRLGINNYVYALSNGSTGQTVADTVAVNSNWAKIAVRMTGTTQTLFVDGRLIGSITGTGHSGHIKFGVTYTSNPVIRLNEIVYIDDRILTDDEVIALHDEADRKFIGLTWLAEMEDPTVSISQIEGFSPLFASAQMMHPTWETNSNLLTDPFSASATFATASWQAIWTYVQENPYVTKLKEIGAEIGIAKTIETDNTWIDYNFGTSASNNFVFGIVNFNDGTGGTSLTPEVPATVGQETCNRTKWGGVFTGTEFMNFYPRYDRYGITATPTTSQLSGNEDWSYNEFTGPWYYTTTEDSYELIFRTASSNANQILLSGQSTYTVEGENNTGTLEDDTRINTYIEYGLNAGRLYVKYYRDLDEEPIEIIGNTNIADGQDHHIVLQRTSASGMYRDHYELNMNIGNANQWSLVSGVDKHAVVGQQTIEDKFYSDPFTGEIFHGFEIWVDGQLDTRSASFNSSHIAPIVKSLGGRTAISTTQGPGGQAILSRVTTSGIVGTLTTFFARFNTERINALSSYGTDLADMPRFPQEAKIIKRAALDPPTIKILSQLALSDSNIQYVDEGLASASFIAPTISTNVKKLLRLYWNGPDAVGTNFGATTDGKEFVVDTYSVKYELSNNPSDVYNVDQANRAGSASATNVAEPVIVDNWRDANGVERLLNINTDLDLDQYEAILFMDYPDNSDEIDSILPDRGYVYIQSQMEQFMARLKQAVVSGKSLYVSSPTLAVKLGIIAKETILEQSYDSNDLISASVNPFTTTASVYFDTHRNNKYKIVNEFAGITNISGYVLSDAISYSRGLNDEYHLKYQNKSDGLSVNDTFFIPSLPLIPSQLNQDYAGYTNNRIVNLHVIDPADIITGSAIAALDGTNYITTLALKPGDTLSGSAIAGKIFVNFVEDALTMGITEYNYATIQTGLTSRLPDEDAATIQWNYSTSRTTRKLAAENNIIDSRGSDGQTSPTYGGGGPLVQAPTSSTFGNIRVEHDAENQAFTSSIYFDESSEIYPIQTIFAPSMTWRGMNWLINVDNGEFIRPLPMTASALMPYQTNPDWDIENIINLVIPQTEIINLHIMKEVY